MQIIDSVLAFFTELYNRLTASTPRFFRILQTISGIIAVISAFYEKSGIPVPEWLNWLDFNYTFYSGLIAVIIAQLVVKDPDTAGKLPLTKQD